MKYSFLIPAAATALLFAAGSMQAADSAGNGPAAAYCVASGGVVIDRLPTYGTNGPHTNWLYLNGPRQFCQFTSPEDGSRIHILVETLYDTSPTLAALAYYAKLAPGQGGGGNPSSYYCTYLGGSDSFGGVNAAGGGWVGLNSVDLVLQACIFPDMSSIDSWGLFYDSASIVRGIDLTKVMRYKPAGAVAKP